MPSLRCHMEIMLRPTIRCAPKSPDYVKATISITVDDDNHETWEFGPMSTGLHPGGLNWQRDVRHPALGKFLAATTSLRLMVTGECTDGPYPAVMLVGRCQSPSFCRPAGKALLIGCRHAGYFLAAAYARLQNTYHGIRATWSHFIYSFLLSCRHGTTTQYNSKTTPVRWALITDDRVISGTIFILPVLYVTSYGPWSFHSVTNALAPFDGYMRIPFKEVLLHFRLFRLSLRFRCYYAPLFPHTA